MNETSHTPLPKLSATAKDAVRGDAGTDELSELLQEGSRMFGERREATLLFTDLRRFTDLAESLAHEAVYELLGHVMDCLTAEVIAQEGTVIDYFGDGLAAMWNAPADQADHAERACRAAVGMVESLPEVAADWDGLLEGGKLRLGIGIHTGIVQVGNAGSRRVKKYGPRGGTVHLASRVEAATKLIGVPLVLTGPTASRLSSRFAMYRICRAELPGIDSPVDLYALCPNPTDAQQTADLETYGRGLALLEAGDFEQAKSVLATLPEAAGLPARFLLQHIEQQLGQQNRRRSGDKPTARFGGVVRIDVK